MKQSPLEGIRVLDLSSVLAAPVTATFLGDFGADVIKVEEPGVGDFTRARAATPGGRSLQWVQEGRNKKSVTINLRTEAGQNMVRKMVSEFDVIVTNNRPPTMEQWGLSPDRLQELNPRAVILFLTGYGLTGPYRNRGAFDRIASSYAGLTYVSGDADRPPVRSGFSVLDFMSAYMAAFAVVTALYHRDVNGGEGQIIDLALYEAGVRATEDAIIDYSHTGNIRERAGNKNTYIVPASDFATADGRRVSVHAATDTLFRRLSIAMGQPELSEDERFIDRKARAEHQDDLYPKITEWVAGHSAKAVLAILDDAAVPSSLVMSVADIHVDPHYRERETIIDVEDTEYGPLTMIGPLPHLSGTPGSVRTLGPHLGEHNREIFGDLLGLSDDEISRLTCDGVI